MAKEGSVCESIFKYGDKVNKEALFNIIERLLVKEVKKEVECLALERNFTDGAEAVQEENSLREGEFIYEADGRFSKP